MRYLISALSVFIFCLTISPPAAHADALSLANGYWGIDQNYVAAKDREAYSGNRECESSPMIISTDRKTMRYKVVHTGEKESYTGYADILSAKERYFTIRYDDETRVMSDGQPQIWSMFFLDEDTFVWILGHGISEDERELITIPRVRCEPGIT